jgi:hypothetical protein
MYLYTAAFTPEPTSFAVHWIGVPTGSVRTFDGGDGDEGPGDDGPVVFLSSSPPIMSMALEEDEHTIIPKATTPIIAAWDILLYKKILSLLECNHS